MQIYHMPGSNVWGAVCSLIISTESFMSYLYGIMADLLINFGCFGMFLNNVFCPIVWYTDWSWARCVSPHISRHIFVIWYKTIAKMRRKPQHVGNISSDFPYMLRFLSHLCNGFILMTKTWRDVNVWKHISPCLDLYITQWDKIHYSKTCVWARQ